MSARTQLSAGSHMSTGRGANSAVAFAESKVNANVAASNKRMKKNIIK